MAEKTTKSFILRVDAETMNAIEAWAADEFRSTNGQLQWIITEALRKAKRLPKKKNLQPKEKRIGRKNVEGRGRDGFVDPPVNLGFIQRPPCGLDGCKGRDGWDGPAGDDHRDGTSRWQDGHLW